MSSSSKLSKDEEDDVVEHRLRRDALAGLQVARVQHVFSFAFAFAVLLQHFNTPVVRHGQLPHERQVGRAGIAVRSAPVFVP